jgi:hypothetical protein
MMQSNATTARVSAIKKLPIAPDVAIFAVKVGILSGLGMIKILIA